MSKYEITTMKISSIANPAMWTSPSFSGEIRFPRRAISIRMKKMRPPSSIGSGKMLMIAKFRLSSAASSISRTQPTCSTTSPVTRAMPTGPDRSIGSPPAIQERTRLRTSTNVAPTCSKPRGIASQKL